MRSGHDSTRLDAPEAPPGHKAYSSDEMRRYWRLHSRIWSDLDREQDPEGLTNVCFNGSPLWLNRFAAHCQRKTVLRLLESVPEVRGMRALDVGCGTGRWSRLLSERGALTTGIDLQPESLRENQRRLPACRFIEMSADKLAFMPGTFDLANSVTVLQHVPYDGQVEALKEIRRVLVKGGHFIMLEAIIDRGPHVFSRSRQEWIRQAVTAGFTLRRTVLYDFAPLLYGMRALADLTRGGSGRESLPPVEEYVSKFRSIGERRGIVHGMYRAALRTATVLSYPVEPVVSITGPAILAHHAGFVFQAA